MHFMDRLLDRVSEPAKHWLDVGAILAWVGAVFKFLPEATALLSFIWICLRIWETETVKKWTNRQ